MRPGIFCMGYGCRPDEAAADAGSFLNSADAAGDGSIVAVYDAAYSTLLDAPAGSPASDGGAVGSISDVSGNEAPAVQSTVGARPTLDLDGFGGGPCLTFDGGDYLQLNAWAGGVEEQPNTLVVVFSLATAASFQRVLGVGNAADRNEIVCGSGGNWEQYGGASVDSGIAADTGAHLALGVFDATSSYLVVDGVQGATGSVGAHGSQGICLGGSVGSVLVANGAKIAACAVYAGDIGATARSYIWTQAQARWGL